MRPEYIDAVDLVRYGIGSWLYSTPVVLIWIAAVCRRFRYTCFVTAFVCTWVLLVAHSNNIPSEKERLARTEAELADWASDTWNAMAPFTGAVYAFIYCGAHAIVARPTIRFVRFLVEVPADPVPMNEDDPGPPKGTDRT